MKRRLLAVAAALAMALGLTLVVASPAQATSYWGCASGVACVHTGFSGAGLDMTISVGQYGTSVCHNFNADFTNTISSVSNDFGGTNLRLWLFNSSNCYELAHGGLEWWGPSQHGAWNFNTISTLIDDNMANSFMIAFGA